MVNFGFRTLAQPTNRRPLESASSCSGSRGGGLGWKKSVEPPSCSSCAAAGCTQNTHTLTDWHTHTPTRGFLRRWQSALAGRPSYSFFLSLDPCGKKKLQEVLSPDRPETCEDDPKRRALFSAKSITFSGATTEIERTEPPATFRDSRRVIFSTGNR